MEPVVIKAENLGKRYQIGKVQEKHPTLRGNLPRILASPFRRAGNWMRRRSDEGSNHEDTIWALKDINLEIRRGEIFGLVGSNGAGKSTLLKILSRITEPTLGHAEIRGQMGSLLEVGTGFHPQLTGRENILLNGAILGMKRAEIERKFDEIVAFSELEKFIDTPVRHYSSGMFVRLAFSVAAHLEPQILLVDEVLAVGDARFYSKSTQRMKALNARGMTIVLVTHNMWLVQSMCSRAIYMENGQIKLEGDPLKVIGAYRKLVESRTFQTTVSQVTPEGRRKGTAEITNCTMLPHGKWASPKEAYPYSGMKLLLAAQVQQVPAVMFLVRVTSPDGLPYFTVYSKPVSPEGDGPVNCDVTIPELRLLAGEYTLWCAICTEAGDSGILDETSLSFVVIDDSGTDRRVNLFWNTAEWLFHEGVPVDSLISKL